jgi:hypothetical protein
MKSIIYLPLLAFSQVPSHGFHAPQALSIKSHRTPHIIDQSASRPQPLPCDDSTRTSVLKSTVLAASIHFSVFANLFGSAAWAVSGGGLDYAGIDITGQDFSNGNYKGKDFTQASIKEYMK